MKEADDPFWERLDGMPLIEAEQECVIRRESLALEIAMMQVERAKLTPPIGSAQHKALAELGAAMSENMAQLTKLNERIKYLRKLQAKIEWRETVRALFGDEAVEQCIVYMEHRWAEVRELRRQFS